MTKKKKCRSKWIKWATVKDREAPYLPSGWYWVAYLDGSVELMFWDYEGEWYTIDGEADEEATLSNLVRTETIYAIKRVVMEKHPLTEDAK